MMTNEKREENKIRRRVNIKKTLIISFSIILLIILGIIVSIYLSNENFRNWVDVNILRKDITSTDISSIDLDTDKNNQIFCYSKYVCILNDKNLKLYNNLGEDVSELSVDINTAIFDSNEKYLAMAEKNGQGFCVILDKTYLWREKTDGEILQIHVNKNGYVALVTTDTTFKSIITIYDSEGNQLLRKFLSSTRVIDVEIYNDNKYVALAEVDTSGTLIQSNIEIISIEKAQQNSDDAIIYSNKAETSKMIVNIESQDKGNLICVYNDSVNVITNRGRKTINRIK